MTTPPFQKAQWIWQQNAAKPDEYCDFLAEFDAFAEGTAPRYYLSVAADSNYTVWLNGALAAFGQYADYPHYKVYDRVDITAFVKAGKNRFVLTAWYMGVHSSTYAPGTAGVIFEVTDEAGKVLAHSSTDTLARLSRDYINHRVHYITPMLGITYAYDMTGDDGYREAGGEGFAPARAEDTISTEFHLRPNQKLVLRPRLAASVCQCGTFGGMGRFAGQHTRNNHPGDEAMLSRPCVQMQYADLAFRYFDEMAPEGSRTFDKPTKIAMPEGDTGHDGIYFIVDLGTETAGFLDFDVEVPTDCLMAVGWGEHIEDGRARTSNGAYSVEIQLKAGRNEFLNTFRRFGCRYVQFFVYTNEMTVHYAGLRPAEYPLKHKKYRSGNLLRDTIYEICQNSLQHCLHEHYEDCPWREQALYCLDSRNQMLCGYYAFEEYEAARASLELYAVSPRPDGLMRLCAPTSGDGAAIVSFSCAYIMQMAEYIAYSGDKSLAEQYFSVLTGIMETLAAQSQPCGVIGCIYTPGTWNFYEWVQHLSGYVEGYERHLDAPLNAFYSIALKYMADICDALGKTDEATAYRALRAPLNAAIVKVFYNPEVKLFESFDEAHRGTYHVLTQALCLLCGAADGLDNTLLFDILATNGAGDHGFRVIPNTTSMNAFRFDALLRADKEKFAPIILDELDREYLKMLRAGATSVWETALGAEDFGGQGNGSLCHGWSALPIYYYELLN